MSDQHSKTADAVTRRCHEAAAQIALSGTATVQITSGELLRMLCAAARAGALIGIDSLIDAHKAPADELAAKRAARDLADAQPQGAA